MKSYTDQLGRGGGERKDDVCRRARILLIRGNHFRRFDASAEYGGGSGGRPRAHNGWRTDGDDCRRVSQQPMGRQRAHSSWAARHARGIALGEENQAAVRGASK